MDCNAEDLLYDLECLFVKSSSTNNLVRTEDGVTVSIDTSIWNASPVLTKHAEGSESCFTVNCSQDTINAMLYAYREHKFPEDTLSLMDLMVVADQLELKELLGQCKEKLFFNKKFWTEAYPSGCSFRTAARCFTIMVRTPLRERKIYLKQLQRLSDYCSNEPKLMATVMTAFRRIVKRYFQLNLGSIPVAFEQCSVPIAIIRNTGKPQTAIFDGDSWIPVELFGKNFDLTQFSIESFYLKYGSYVLFKSNRQVYRKNLCNNSEPVLVLDNCTFFLVKRRYVFAVTESDQAPDDTQRCSIFSWTNDEYFVKVYEVSSAIFSIDFHCETLRMLVWTSDSLNGTTLSLLKLTNESLSLRDYTEVPDLQCSIFFYDEILIKRSSFPEVEISFEDWGFKITSFNDDTEMIFMNARTVCHSGHLFNFSENGTLFVLKPKKNIAMLPYEHFDALSELNLFEISNFSFDSDVVV